MKQIFLISILFFSFIMPQNLNAKLVIVSDIDDTIRRTETLNPGRALLNLMSSTVASYEGIRNIFWDLWANHKDTQFYYVSSSIKEFYDGV